LKKNKTILLEIDIQGAKQVKELYPDGVFIFIIPPSLQTLSERLHGRGTETEEIIHSDWPKPFRNWTKSGIIIILWKMITLMRL
jgi:hypothetical protein